MRPPPRPPPLMRVCVAATCIFGVCSALDPHLMQGGARNRPLLQQQFLDFSAGEPEAAASLISGLAECGVGPTRATGGFVAVPWTIRDHRSHLDNSRLGLGGSACSWLHGRSLGGSSIVGRKRSSPGSRSGGILGMTMFGRLVIQAERQFISGMTGHVSCSATEPATLKFALRMQQHLGW